MPEPIRAPWSPLNWDGSIREPILGAIEVLRQAGLIEHVPGSGMTLAQLEQLGQTEWATGHSRERVDLEPWGQPLEREVWPFFTGAGFTAAHQPNALAHGMRYNAILATWGGAAACLDKLGFAAEWAVNGVDFGEFVSLAVDRRLKRDDGESDSENNFSYPERRYGHLRWIYAQGGHELLYETEMIELYWRRLALPRQLWSLRFWQAGKTDLQRDGVMRARALQALGFWPGRPYASGPYALLTKGPHFPFHCLDFGDALGSNARIEVIGPGIEPGFVGNSVAQLFDALARAVHCYIKFEKRQGRDALA